MSRLRTLVEWLFVVHAIIYRKPTCWSVVSYGLPDGVGRYSGGFVSLLMRLIGEQGSNGLGRVGHATCTFILVQEALYGQFVVVKVFVLNNPF